ncbi:MAG: tetratricopeptide repeat protein [Burkholderiales bacterium]
MDDTEMSLINRMLQDLAQRQAPSNGAPSQINPLGPSPKSKNRPLWTGLILMVLVNIATLAWFLHHGSVRNTARTPLRTAVVKPVKLAITPPFAPLASIRKPPPVIALAETPPIKPAAPVAAAMMKPEPATTSGIIAAANAGVPVAPVAIASAASREASTSPADIPPPTPPAAQSAVTAPADGTMAIRKQTKQLSPAQLAQNEYVSALNLARQGDLQGAIDGFTRVLSLDPRHHQARLMLAGLLIESKRFNEAEKLLQTGLTQDPAQIDFATLLARLQVEHDSLDASIATLTHSLPYAANQADYQAFLAALLQRSGKNEQAIDHYVIALKQNPQSGLWWMGLGIAEKAAGHVAEAHEAFARAKATNSLSPELQAYVEQQLRQP